MALALGTNSGFVTTAPTADPEGSTHLLENYSQGGRDTSPATAGKIIEIGFYSSVSEDTQNFEVAIYDDISNVPTNIIHVERTNSLTTGAGWKRVSVDWEIDPDTVYWLFAQADPIIGNTYIDYKSSTGSGQIDISGQTTLVEPITGGYDADGILAIYVVWEEAPTGFTRKIKISGTFQDKPIKTKVGGTFVDKPIKIKVGGTFQDA